MTSIEKRQIQVLPKSLRPMSTLGFMFYTILFSLGPIGLIAVIICSVSAKNITLRHYARSTILLSVITAAVTAALIVLGVLNYDLFMEYAQKFVPEQQPDQQQTMAMLASLL